MKAKINSGPYYDSWTGSANFYDMLKILRAECKKRDAQRCKKQTVRDQGEKIFHLTKRIP
jgi:hypothetical protein